MFSNLKRIVTLSLLASTANPVFAVPAPVSDISGDNSPPNYSNVSSNETDVERLERLLNNRNRVQLQMQQQLDDMALEISDLRGQLEKNNYDMQQMLQRQRDLFVELDKLRGQASAVPAEVKDASAQPSVGKFSSNQDEQMAYQNAVDLILKKRDYSGAISAFQQFQKDFPDSTFTPNAHYWLGQLYFAKKQDKEAVKSFAAVVSYKKSNKRADALVKLGDVAKRNNNLTQAKKYYQQVIEEYPQSASAKQAAERIK
ncbi:tol-pal system protein YbgF [Vibrio ostreicida]|uniref:Cell division coordinator CpoB n=1 Tax=Vibrio ostreicida TaxID=526588 RepID=A0ABT8BR62_9VIBR|nr:tol-pal system protein YbgF [Vibrio ostreicida]MDN3609632.1 tol-pal system protein YbgF [Vibrio ostreicida]NPD08503.1 tol-pal system protein YbgF [Vibrio ostreicida]